MPEWKRTTVEVSLEKIRPELLAALQKHIDQYNLGEILPDALMSIQTDSERAKKSLFGGAELIYMGVILTPRWLLWAVSGIKTPPAVLSAQLQDVVIQDYAQTTFVKLAPDSGVQVNGIFTDNSENSSAFIGLEENPVGARFKALLLKAAQDAKQ